MNEIATRPANATEILRQVGRMNVLAISGGRAEATVSRDIDGEFIDGVRLPVHYGYAVEIRLAANDTYTVLRTFTRSGKRSVKAEWTEVYADQVSEIAYTASCFRD